MIDKFKLEVIQNDKELNNQFKKLVEDFVILHNYSNEIYYCNIRLESLEWENSLSGQDSPNDLYKEMIPLNKKYNNLNREYAYKLKEVINFNNNVDFEYIEEFLTIDINEEDIKSFIIENYF